MKNNLIAVFVALACLLHLLPAESAEPSSRGVVPVPETVRPVQAPNAKPRHVVFILSDDHRYDAMSFMGHQLAETPHMDAMAATGVHLKKRVRDHITLLAQPSLDPDRSLHLSASRH